MISDALDPHEVPRIEFDDEWTYLIARLPDTLTTILTILLPRRFYSALIKIIS
ncbi:hypothetical protein KOY48_05150 [Candidatus Minimicrobia naudis]|uniref:Uncharacterized protein n=1 Tax=Candidatus Minimicrobia naudis TaxID=2841263 RepID=A0A8F1SB33_9BACT|nr:hypothetical protein KOY48_05150 [Candidatus Minimicrobia naudis]